ncbi:MAG TPA: DNA polymerase III subunit alpha [Fimbriimonas sp.]|nr:DNA polymerase III subunit alpha [Fimbriimonas sp.]
MPPAGDELLAQWREVGEWWDLKPQRLVRRFIDEKGNCKEESKDLPALSLVSPEITQSAQAIAHSIRVRDDTVARACGYAPEPPSLEEVKSQPYAVLHCLSGYSFGRSAMIAAAIPAFAKAGEARAALLADSLSLSGAAEFTTICLQAGLHPLIGATLEMADGGELVLVARNPVGFRSLSRLVTDCHLEEPRLFPLCNWERLERHTDGLLCLTGGDEGPINRALMSRDTVHASRMIDRLIGLYGRDNVFVEIERTDLPWQISVNRQLLDLSEKKCLLPVAGGQLTHAYPGQFAAQDMLVCIESLCLIEEVVGRKPRRDASQPPIRLPPRRALNAERYLRPYQEQLGRYADRPDLVENTMRVAERCDRYVLPGRTELPTFCENEPQRLQQLVWEGSKRCYPQLTRRQENRIKKELKIITQNKYSGHFLIAADMCRWATEQGIVHSGRGSVVDSMVAYCLGMSRIDAYEHNLHFDRFLPVDGSKRPDIDIDFEAHRRDDVRNYLIQKYGDKHVATVAAIGAYCTRGIIREVGKVMGIPEESLAYLAKRLHGSVSPHRLEREISLKPELRGSDIPMERFRWVFQLANDLMDIPRGMRSHSSGVVISKDPIADTAPVMFSGVEGVKIIQWDKRSAKKCFDKFDVLCLRGNDVLSTTQKQIRVHRPGFDVRDLPLDDQETYRTMRSGELIGIPQSASPAMRQAHIRLRTENFKDAGIVQAAIRPGVGGAVKINEYIARRRGKPFTFIHDKLEEILGETHGIVVFQEQIDRLLQTFGGYSPGEAEEIREAIHKRRHEGYVKEIQSAVLEKIKGQGFNDEVAKEVYELVAVFQGYGFAQGHALAFAEISIRSIWCQQNYPAEYFAAILDAQPAGYYGPATLVNEARRRGVKVLPPDVNLSELTFRVEDVQSLQDPKIVMPNAGIRVSLKQIGGLSKVTVERIVTQREHAPYLSLADFAARVKPHRDELELLVLCGAFDRIERNRRRLLWGIPEALRYAELVASTKGALPVCLKDPPLAGGIEGFSELEEALYERKILDLDVEKHLMAFERPRILAKGGLTAIEAGRLQNNTKAFAVGNPIRLRFPPTASGKRVLFFDLEDESGLLNVTCFDETYQRDGHTVICSPYITVRGVAQERDDHIAFLAERIYPYKPVIESHKPSHEPLPLVIGDFLMT